jgi:hypothetical protein
MKVLTFGTCRVLQLFDKSINNTFLESIHYTNLGNLGGENVISFSHDIYQVIFLLNLIKDKKNINDIDNNLIKKFSVFIQNNGGYRGNYLSKNPNYNINDSIIQINNQLKEIEYLILEVCSLKKLIIDGVPMYLDINDQDQFTKITDEEFTKDFDNLVNLVATINTNIKIIFVSHIQYNNEIIPERKHILDLLKINCEKYNNCFVLCPNDYITNNDLEDARHYKPESRIKILNAIKDKIIDIESNKIVDDMNHKGIMNFSIKKYLNNSELLAYDHLNNTLTQMTERIKNNTHYKKKYDDNYYLYSVNNFLEEPYNLDNPIFVNFFKIVLNDLIIKIAEKYLENNVYIYNALMAVNYNCSSNRVQSQHWHRDPGGRKLIKFFIFFDKIGELNGSFEYIPNSQYTSKSRISKIFDNNDARSIYPIQSSNEPLLNEFDELQKNNKLITEADEYDCISVDTCGFHRAGICSPNYYRKYLHVLFLIEKDILENKDGNDLYQKGFNYHKIYNIDIKKIDEVLKKKVSKYFYNP